MIALWVLALVASLAGMSFASRRAVTSALRITDALKVSPALVGLTVLSIGTDLPEIANSLVSTATGHGDVNVGDSMGSVLTQITLALGLICLLGHNIRTDRNFVLGVGTATLFATIMVRILLDDGDLSHTDGLLLVTLWFAGTALLGHGEIRPRQVVATGGGVGSELFVAFMWLGAVGALAFVAVQSFLAISDDLGVPEFAGSFIALSIGTSLPELFVDLTAIRRGASAMAIGAVFGASFVDATLSVGIGPAIFSSTVSEEAFIGPTLAAVGVLIATLLVVRAKHTDWRLGVPLLVVYATIQTAIIVLA